MDTPAAHSAAVHTITIDNPAKGNILGSDAIRSLRAARTVWDAPGFVRTLRREV